MNILGKQYTREELLRYSNPVSGLYGVRRVEMAEGRARGQKFFDVRTAGGLRAFISEDRCLDIVELEYKGVNLGFLTKNGINSTALHNPETQSFRRYYTGGFVNTCGLRNTGFTCNVDGEFFPVHGHIGMTPADHVSVNVTEEEITISGIMRETAFGGWSLEMKRTITLPSDGAKVTVSDVIHNLTPQPEIILFMYHVNFGFPFLNESLKIEYPESEKVIGHPLMPASQQNFDKRMEITPPVDGDPEMCYSHFLKNKDVTVRLHNEDLGIKGKMCFDGEKLPILTQWKSMRPGDYALGLEPGNSRLMNRENELKDGFDTKVSGYGSLEYGFSFSVE